LRAKEWRQIAGDVVIHRFLAQHRVGSQVSLQQWVVLTGVAKRFRTMYHGLLEVITESRKEFADNTLIVDGQVWRRSAVSVPDSSWVVV
jgi:hypothetical protein